MPQQVNFNCTYGIPSTKGPGRIKGFDEIIPIFEERNYTITGVTKNNAGAALGGCVVKLFNTATDILEQTTISDGSGNYSFVIDKTKSWYVVSYKAGAPDVAGTSVNTLVGV